MTDEKYEIFEIVAVIYGVMIAMMVFPSILPVMPATFGALVSARKIYDVIERTPEIRSESNCQQECNLKNAINFEDITFRYPK